MPKFARSTSYAGAKGTVQHTGDVRFANIVEASNDEIDSLAISPAVLADIAPSLIPDATTLIEGKVSLATNAEAVTGTINTNKAIIPSSLTARLQAPGAIGGTTPGAATFTTLTAVGAVSLNASGAAATTIGTGGTGAVNIGNATGNTAVTGSLTASTTLTATLGAITATNGNFVKGTAGNKDIYSSVATNATAGANSAGTVTLVGGTATIATTAVTANSLIRLYRQSVGATGAAALGYITRGTITPATSFVINSVQAADATALQATDVSVVFWEIVN